MQTAATTAARARADGATASTAWRRSRRRAGENRPPTARTTAAAVASSATTASRARNSETVSTVTTGPALSAVEGGQGVGGVDGPVGGERPAEGGGRRGAAAGGQGGHGVEHRHHLPQRAGRREVLLLVGHIDLLHAEAGAEPGDDGLDDVLRGAGAGGHADDPGAGQGGLVELVDPVDALYHRAPDVPGHLFQGPRVRRVGAADDDPALGPA